MAKGSKGVTEAERNFLKLRRALYNGKTKAFNEQGWTSDNTVKTSEAITKLGETGDRRAIGDLGPLVGMEKLPDLILIRTVEALYKIASLGQLGDNDMEKVLTHIERISLNDDPNVRFAALKPAINMAKREDLEPKTRDAFISIIGKIAKHRNELLAKAAIYSLMERGGKKAIEELGKMVSEPDFFFPEDAVTALGMIGMNNGTGTDEVGNVIKHLGEAVEHDNAQVVKKAVSNMASIVRMKKLTPAQVSMLVSSIGKGTQHTGELVVREAVEGLRGLIAVQSGMPESDKLMIISSLKKAAANRNPDVAMNAVLGLSSMNHPKAFEALKENIGNPDSRVSKTIFEILRDRSTAKKPTQGK